MGDQYDEQAQRIILDWIDCETVSTSCLANLIADSLRAADDGALEDAAKEAVIVGSLETADRIRALKGGRDHG